MSAVPDLSQSRVLRLTDSLSTRGLALSTGALLRNVADIMKPNSCTGMVIHSFLERCNVPIFTDISFQKVPL